MQARTWWAAVIGVFAAIAATGSEAVGAVDTTIATSKETHCVVAVVDQKPDGEFIVTDPVCGDTRSDAYVTLRAETQLSATFTLGIHYDGFNYTGSSFSVVGSECAGGYLNLSTSWINRVSSTANGCYRVTHYDGFNRTGSSQSTLGSGGNLSSLNNEANSIAYFAW